MADGVVSKLPFNVLDQDQVNLLGKYPAQMPSTAEQIWDALSPSGQVEYGAGTFALEEEAKKVLACSLPECVASLIQISGDLGDGVASANQFNVQVCWQKKAKDFGDHWFPHIAILHPG
ncbi:MAG TPA: hypothetical protein VI756_12200, partial [Blastocatellia bacterium]